MCGGGWVGGLSQRFKKNCRSWSSSSVSLDERGPSKAEPDSFKSFQHICHPLVVKFVGGIDYRVGLHFVVLRRMYQGPE